jgi:hypothetical protein
MSLRRSLRLLLLRLLRFYHARGLAVLIFVLPVRLGLHR